MLSFNRIRTYCKPQERLETVNLANCKNVLKSVNLANRKERFENR